MAQILGWQIVPMHKPCRFMYITEIKLSLQTTNIVYSNFKKGTKSHFQKRQPTSFSIESEKLYNLGHSKLITSSLDSLVQKTFVALFFITFQKISIFIHIQIKNIPACSLKYPKQIKLLFPHQFWMMLSLHIFHFQREKLKS